MFDENSVSLLTELLGKEKKYNEIMELFENYWKPQKKLPNITLLSKAIFFSVILKKKTVILFLKANNFGFYLRTIKTRRKRSLLC